MTDTTYIIATATKPLGEDNFKFICRMLRERAKEGNLEITSGIIWTPGPGCNNVAFQVTGDEKEAEKFLNAITMALMPAKWGTTADAVPSEDTWEH